MSTQQLLDHDLNANGNRILQAKGADVTIASNTLALGNGNLFRVIPGAGTGDDELMYIQTAGWTAGSVVYLEVTREEDDISLMDGTSPPAGAASLLVPGGAADLAAGQTAALVYDGNDFRVINVTAGGAPSGSGQAIGRGADLTIDSNNTITLPAAGSANLFRVNPGSGTGEDNLGAIITPSGWEAGSTIYLQAPTDGGNAINLMGLEGTPPGGAVAILFGARTYEGELSADQLLTLVYDGTQWIVPNTQTPPVS